VSHYLVKPDNPEELLHFGVKGMKWGSRKGVSNTASGTKQRVSSAVQSIKSHAPSKETVATVAKGAIVAGALLKTFGPVAIQAVAMRAENQRGRAATRNLADQLNRIGGGTESKKNRKGVYNITNI
jgi:hypothetical protein